MRMNAVCFADLCCRVYRHATETRNTHFSIEAMAEMVRRAEAYARLQETSCNRDLTKREQTREAGLEKRITAAAAELGLSVTFSGDPRGYTVKLQGIGDNGWGRDGWGIA